MPLTNFDFPGVTLKQVFTQTSTGTVGTLGVACIGQQYKLHRADVTSEAAQLTTAYVPGTGVTETPLPGRDLSTTIDTDTTTQRLLVKNGQWLYATSSSSTTGFTPSLPTGTANTIQFSSPVKACASYPITYSGLGSRGIIVGDTVILTSGTGSSATTVVAIVVDILYVANAGYTQIVVDTLGGITTLTSVGLCIGSNATFSPGAGTFSISTATTGGSVTVYALSLTLTDPAVSATLQSGDLYLEYREQASTYVGKLGSVADPSEVEDKLGGVCAENPLAQAVYFAVSASKGVVVYFTGVRTNNLAGYTEAFDFLDKYSTVYSLVPATEDQSVILAAFIAANSVSDDIESKVRRTVFYGATCPAEIDLVTAKATATAATSGQQDGKITFTTSVFKTYPFKTGDVIESAAGTRYVISTTNGVNEATVTTDPGTVATAADYTLIRTAPGNEDMIEEIIRRRYTANYRCQCVWADDVVFNNEVVPNFAIAAAAAGMRSYEPCHRPISNLAYTFFTVADTNGFTRSQLKELGANGIWIIDNRNGEPVNMRQITTAMANDVNLDEESVVSNADSIGISLSHVGENYVGNSNISETLLSILRVEIKTLMDTFITETNGSNYIGPQLLSWELTSIYQDTVNLDRVYATITCNPPKPFNKFNITMRVV